jgi:hypothetical protein
VEDLGDEEHEVPELSMITDRTTMAWSSTTWASASVRWRPTMMVNLMS